jgi:hypothetical protein
MKDLIIGGCSGYEWKDVKNWVNSIRRSGFKGDVALVGTNISKTFQDKLTEEGIIVKAYGVKNENGDIVSPQTEAPHVQRFFFLWEFLESSKDYYRYVVTTDTRDVVFQKDPIGWLEENLYLNSLIASSEGMSYINEPWGYKNIGDTFGPYFQSKMRNSTIYNVGTIAGNFRSVKSLLLMIYQMSLNRPVKVVDQAVYNMILMDSAYLDCTNFTTNEDGWAIQLGTTLPAVQSGSGDLGQLHQHASFAYEYGYKDSSPSINYDTGLIYNTNGTLFNIVHQYDRIPKLKEVIDLKYGDNDDVYESRTTFHHPV